MTTARRGGIGALALAAVVHAAWAAPATQMAGLPASAPAAQTRLLAGLPASLLDWIAAEARAVAGGAPIGGVHADVARQYPHVTRAADQNALVFLVLMQADSDIAGATPAHGAPAGYGALPGVGVSYTNTPANYVNAPANATNAANGTSLAPWQTNAASPWGAAATTSQVTPAGTAPARQAAAASAWGSPASASDLSQASQLSVQQLASQREQIEQALSNIMQSMSDTSTAIVDNIK